MDTTAQWPLGGVLPMTQLAASRDPLAAIEPLLDDTDQAL